MFTIKKTFKNTWPHFQISFLPNGAILLDQDYDLINVMTHVISDLQIYGCPSNEIMNTSIEKNNLSSLLPSYDDFFMQIHE